MGVVGRQPYVIYIPTPCRKEKGRFEEERGPRCTVKWKTGDPPTQKTASLVKTYVGKEFIGKPVLMS